MNVSDYIGWRVLVTIGDNDAIRETAISRISPNGKYVCLESFYKEVIGWVPIEHVCIVDAIAQGDRDGPLDQAGKPVNFGPTIPGQYVECKPGSRWWFKEFK